MLPSGFPPRNAPPACLVEARRANDLGAHWTVDSQGSVSAGARLKVGGPRLLRRRVPESIDAHRPLAREDFQDLAPGARELNGDRVARSAASRYDREVGTAENKTPSGAMSR